MIESYIPKWSQKDFCEWINLCTIRKNERWENNIWVKKLNWEIFEENLENILNADNYQWLIIVRTYASWHVFISEDLKQVYLLTTSKDWKIQHQFTGWSPQEEENKNVIIKDWWVYKFNIPKVRANARLRTKLRTWVDVIEEFNDRPIVDWVLMENEVNWERFFRLVCLMHFIVEKYKWNLSFTNEEYVIEWKWYNIDDLPNTPNVSPNAYIVSKKCLEELSNY